MRHEKYRVVTNYGEKVCVLRSKIRNLQLADITSDFTPNQRILIVDHYRVGQRTALMQLQYFGLSAHVVNSCRQAIKAIKKQDYALVLIGWGMPDCNGASCIKFVRKQDIKRNTHTTIVAVASHARAGDKDYCKNFGMDDLISKPITMPDMQSLLRRHLKAA